jgi:hypothetical protein
VDAHESLETGEYSSARSDGLASPWLGSGWAMTAGSAR